MSDTSKTIRSFQCRDSLWERFEQMARELECSVDYLVNDAMKQYARQRGYGAGSVSLPASRSIQPPITSVAAPVPPPPPAFVAPPAVPAYNPPAPPPPPPPAFVTQAPPTIARGGLPAPPPPAPPVINYSAAPPVPPPPFGAPPPPVGYAAPHSPAPYNAPPPPAPPAPSRAPGPPRSPVPPKRGMFVYYGGERFVVNKDRFIIGRGKQSSDLTIKDPNVSRQHALVEYSDGRYYMVDMGSTNGVEFGGRRVQRQPINDGDVFRVCDHELRFSYN